MKIEKIINSFVDRHVEILTRIAIVIILVSAIAFFCVLKT